MTENKDFETLEQLRLKLEIAKLEATTKLAEEQRKLEEAKTRQEEAKTRQKEIELLMAQGKRKSDEEADASKRMKTSHESAASSKNTYLKSLLGNAEYFKVNQPNYIGPFNITSLLNDNRNVNDDMINSFQKSFIVTNLTLTCLEDVVQSILDESISKLLDTYHCLTSLKYLKTNKYNYLQGKAPDCSFTFKNINVDMEPLHVLNNFVVCIGEFKKPDVDINGPSAIGQLMHYLSYILDLQTDRLKVYGFLTNIEYVKFLYVEKDADDPAIHRYHHSDPLAMFETKRFCNTLSSTMDSTAIEELKESCFNKHTLRTFIQFLTMHWEFYEYTTLNITPDDDFYGDRYTMHLKLGSGATSMVFQLDKNANNRLQDDPTKLVMKISRGDSYAEYLINESNMLTELKKSMNSDKNFDLFFENVYKSSLKPGNICLLNLFFVFSIYSKSIDQRCVCFQVNFYCSKIFWEL